MSRSRAEQTELERRERSYRGDRPAIDVRGRTVIVVDDGLATGASMRAAVAALRQMQPQRIVVADIGGVWDTLLSQGEQVWGALASSDFHNDDMDYTPCTYSLTHIQVPERSQSGVLQALRAGSFWADHGHILDRLSFIIVAPGLPLPATPGETIRVPADATLQLRVLLQRGIGALNAPMTVDIIGNSRSGNPELLANQTLAAAQNTFDWSPGKMLVGADGKSSYFRVRVNTKDGAGKPLHAYIPIRFAWYSNRL